MLKAANLDWEVQLRSLAVSVAENGQNVWRHTPVSQFRAVVRKDTGEVYAIPTKRYNVVQNREVARFFADFCDAGSCSLEVLGALEGGRKVWALASVNSDYALKGNHDKLMGYVMLATSHDGSLRTVAMGTSIRVVCWNTMSAALSERGISKNGKVSKSTKNVFSLKHTGKFNDLAKKDAAQVVGLVKEQCQSTAEMADTFASIRLDGKGRIEFIRRLLTNGSNVIDAIVDSQIDSRENLLDSIVADQSNDQKKPEETRVGQAIIEAIINSPGAELSTASNTLWGAINGVTYFVDHERGRNRDTALSAAFFGQGADLKAKAIDVAYDMSGSRR
jgi:phage/plasmid-like protein (TIGR03299 family)